VEDVAVAGTVKNRAAIVQKKTGRPWATKAWFARWF
jgi:hypothetical protein